MADAAAVVLLPGAGRRITGGSLDAAVKVTTDHPALTSAFEVVIGPGFDVGAHVHAHGEELFYVVEGELDVLAFEPLDRAVPDWHHWHSSTGERFLRGGPGAFMFVPRVSRTRSATRPASRSRSSSSPRDEVAGLRTRYDIEQITAPH